MSTHASGNAHVSATGISAFKSNVGSSSKKRKGAQGPLASAFSLQACKQADQALCRFFYAEDIPAEWKVRSPFFLEMVKAIGQVGPSYVPPTYNALRTTELNDKVKCIGHEIMGVREKWKKHGCTIVCDGWSDTRPSITISMDGMIAAFYSVWFSICKTLHDEEKIGRVLPADLERGLTEEDVKIVKVGMSQYIQSLAQHAKVGKENVVQVITDNASNCASMGRKLEAEFPFIVWTPCASHCIDLLLEDIGELPWVKDTLSQALSVVTFINVKVNVLAILRTYSDLELKKPSATRFAAMWLLLERLYGVQNKLQKTVVSDEFKEWLEGETTTSQQEAKAIQRLCLKKEFWQEVKGLVIAILPLYKVLRMTDMEGSTIGLLHHFMEEASKEIEASTILDGPIDGSR
ncbi:hypothetical protein L7F22_041814 [Adiantum nelumboides]|nr:hypothetical protein [Adiantum nelumboides]